LRLNAGAFVRHGVTLHREFAEVPAITVDKHKVLQILVNLVRNAKYACDESGRADKLITLRIEKAQAGIRICVVDNGVGIPAENMSRLFTHGFTTRPDGHGFGLHSGALAAQELGGSLLVTSDGPGRGATFILELPCSPTQSTHV
jgi:signal transduction histidine kinase